MHDCGFGLIGPRQVHAESKPQSCIWVMKSLSDVVNDSEDCSRVISLTPVKQFSNVIVSIAKVILLYMPIIGQKIDRIMTALYMAENETN